MSRSASRGAVDDDEELERLLAALGLWPVPGEESEWPRLDDAAELGDWDEAD